MLAPLLLIVPVTVPMELLGAFLVFVVAVACIAALAAYWQLVLATLDERQYKFGRVFWLGLAAASFVVVPLLVASAGALSFIEPFAARFWLIAISPALLSAGHFVYLQRGKPRQGEALRSDALYLPDVPKQE